MNVAKIVLKNVAASWVGLGSQIVVTLLLTPFVIEKLGTEAYGVWLLLQGFVGYYGFVDMGLRAGLTQSITRRIAADDVDAVRRHISAATPILGGLSAIIMAIALVMAWLLPAFVEMSDSLANSIWMVVLVQAIGAAAKMPIVPFGAVLVGLQRYDIANGVSVFTRVLFALSTWATLGAGGGLVGLSVVMMITNCLDCLIRMIVARRLLPGIKGAGFTTDRSELKEITNVGIWNFLIGISRQFIYFSDAIVVGILFSAKAVAPYGIAASVVDYGNRLVISATKVLFPAMTHLCKNGSLEAQRDLYITATRMTLGVSSTVLIVGIAWIQPFLLVWLGDTVENREIHAQAPATFAMLGFAFAFVGFQRAGIQLLFAKNHLSVVAKLMFAEAILNLIFSLICGFYLGPIGIAVGTLIPAFFLSMFVHVPIHAKTLDISFVHLLANVLKRPLLYAGFLGGGLALATRFVPTPTTWVSLILVGLLSFVWICLCAGVLLSKQQRMATTEILKTKVIGRLFNGLQGSR